MTGFCITGAGEGATWEPHVNLVWVFFVLPVILHDCMTASQHPQPHVVTSSDGHLSFEITHTHINLLIIPCQSNFMLEILSASANLVGNCENKLQPMKTDPQYIHYISIGKRRRERKKTGKGSAKSSTLIRYTIIYK